MKWELVGRLHNCSCWALPPHSFDTESSTQAEGKAGPYEWFTYKETEAMVDDIASAMTKSGLSAHEKCSIYGANCAQWMIAMQVLSASCASMLQSLYSLRKRSVR